MTSTMGSAVTENTLRSSTYLTMSYRHVIHHNEVSFHSPKLRFSSTGMSSRGKLRPALRAQSSNASFSPWTSFEELFSNFRSFWQTLLEPSIASNESSSDSVIIEGSPAHEVEDESSPTTALKPEESSSDYIARVSRLVKLVDSKDIIELQLKQPDCEILIRRNKALTSLSIPATYVETLLPQALAPIPKTAPTLCEAQPPKSLHPPLKCPMAGTFYRSPAPGEPPFVKVGDKVKKGQIVCIIEAMKLMNDIEADQSGTVVEILVEDGKPVSVDTPLLVIGP